MGRNPEDTEIVAALTAALTGLGSKFWWAAKEDDVHSKMVPHIRWLQNNQHYRHVNNLHFMRMYGNYDANSLSIGNYSRPKSERVTLNVTKSCINTFTAKIAKNRPAVSYVTEDGNSKLQRMARKRNSFSRGALYSVDAYRKGPRVVRDGATMGTGLVKVYSFDGKLCSDRTLIDEIYVDDMEALHGDPRNMFQVKSVPREIALALYAWDEETQSVDEDIRDAIKAAPKSDPGFAITDSKADCIDIYEGWHLPSYSKSGDGRHCVCIKGKDLVDKEWKRPRFPFAKWVFEEPQLGWYGTGLAEELNGIQLEVNFIVKRIQEAFRLLGVPFVFVEEGSKINTAALKNVIGQIHSYRGTLPQVQVFQTVHPEQINHLQYLVQQAYQITGVSEASAQAKNPLGKNASAAAIHAWDDIDSERFILQGQRYENFIEDWDELLADEAGALAEENDGKFKIAASGKKYGRTFIEEIEWKEVDLAGHPHQAKCFPISSLPDTPALKLETLSEMKDAGWISKEDAVEIADLPDLDKVRRRITGAMDYLDESIDQMLDGGDYEAPEPMQLIMGEQALQRVSSAYFEAKRQGEKDENLDKLRTWMAAFQKLASPPPTPAPAVVPPAVGAPPGGPPMAPPSGGPPPGAPPAPANAPPMAA